MQRLLQPATGLSQPILFDADFTQAGVVVGSRSPQADEMIEEFRRIDGCLFNQLVSQGAEGFFILRIDVSGLANVPEQGGGT